MRMLKSKDLLRLEKSVTISLRNESAVHVQICLNLVKVNDLCLQNRQRFHLQIKLYHNLPLITSHYVHTIHLQGPSFDAQSHACNLI